MATRRREGEGEERHRWIDTWESHDNGQSWRFVNNAVADVGEGNPPAMIRLSDGRLCLTYGDRKPPFEMRAKFSSDGGHTWSDPFVLQTGGGGRDMGYPRDAPASRRKGRHTLLLLHAGEHLPADHRHDLGPGILGTTREVLRCFSLSVAWI